MDIPADEADLYTFFAQENGGSSLSRQAYLRLRDQVVSLKRTPGSPLSETTLAQELGLGRTPIREALQWLACQGLVEVRTRQRAFVANIRVTDLQEIFEVRQETEGYAAGLAAARATAADLVALEQSLAGLDGLDPLADIPAHIEIDREFHRAVSRAAHNRFLQAVLTRLYNLNLRLWYLALERIGPMHSAIEQHRTIFCAIRERNAPGAEAAMRQHVGEFHDRIRAAL
jgi:DNA-binding GntR family transcriptional regulator